MSFGSMSPAMFYVPGRTLVECPRCHKAAWVGDLYVGEAKCPECNEVLASPWKVDFP
jgi:uncharacterized protein with PIN domain